jgi:hypothetical protein
MTSPYITGGRTLARQATPYLLIVLVAVGIGFFAHSLAPPFLVGLLALLSISLVLRELRDAPEAWESDDDLREPMDAKGS